jgi:dipeptidyl aminopeptidase/acylaminoacyl peptidase
MQFEPHWIRQSDRFWYKNKTREGKEFVLVDPANNMQMPAFDQVRLAAALSAASGISVAHAKLPFDAIEYMEDDHAIKFEVKKNIWKCDLKTYQCAKLGESKDVAEDELISPDGRWAAFVKDFNLYVRNVKSGETFQLTTDGQLHWEYAGHTESDTSTVTRRVQGKKVPPLAVWAPDSKKLLTHHLDQRRVKELHLLQYAPPDGGVRPVLHNYRYPFPGEEELASLEYLIIDVEARTNTFVKLEPQTIYFDSPLDSKRAWWSKDGGGIFIITNGRGDKNLKLIEVLADTGEAKLLLEEKGGTHLDLNLDLAAPPNVRDINNGEEIIWFSEREGWAHLYLFDGKSGALKNRVTAGIIAVRDILHLDEKGRWIYFTAGCREEGRDPYYRHLYRAKLDGSALELLTPEDADHTVTFSPTGNYFVDTFSRVDNVPQTLLRSSSGKQIRVLENGDIGLLQQKGWRFPERYRVKARDGVTDIYGVIYYPTGFDSDKKYPLIDGIYPGPQAIRTPKSFTDLFRYDDMAIAELGFIVMTVDGLGTPFRSKAFHDLSYGRLDEAGGLEDHISALRQLAASRPYLDLSRVGIYGHSGGGYASARAILQYPDFFKVAVSSAGNHDQRGYVTDWGEKYLGLVEKDNYLSQSNSTLAGNLKGKLFLVCGDMDDNVHPALTMQLVQALIRANKDFDFLMLPNSNHSFAPNKEYFIRKRWDYFVRHLLGAEPPKDYKIKEIPDG